MTKWVMIVAGINLLIALFKLTGAWRYDIGDTYIITSVHFVWYVIQGLLLISLGILSLLFINKNDVKVTVNKKKKIVFLIWILGIATISLALYQLINTL